MRIELVFTAPLPLCETFGLGGRQQEIHGERDRKLEEARKRRQARRQNAA